MRSQSRTQLGVFTSLHFKPAAGHRRPTPPLVTPGHSQASLGHSLLGSLLLSPGSWCTQELFCALLESVSPFLCQSCDQIPLASKSNSLRVLVPLPDPQVGKSVVGSRIFLTVSKLKSESAGKMDVTVFWNPITEVITDQFCCIQLISCKSLNPLEEKEVNTKRWGSSSGVITETAYHSCLWWEDGKCFQRLEERTKDWNTCQSCLTLWLTHYKSTSVRFCLFLPNILDSHFVLIGSINS